MTAIRRWLVTGALVSAGFLGGALLTGRLQSREAEDAAQRPAAPAGATAAAQPAGAVATGLPDFTQIAARTSPSVVNISAVQVYRQRRFVDPFSNFFGGEDAFPVQRGQSAGSGVIVGADGYVLTNNHVLGQGALQQVTVILSDRRERPAKLVGIDPTTDLALLKIAERNLPAVTWGDSGQLKVAEWVLAVGNPYQLGQTVTLGIVSGLNRSYEDVSSIVDYIQTDAAINPGNSGGALINRRGELVGINTWIYSQSGGDQGIGFAIPSNIARRVSEEIIRTGEVKRGTIGEIQLASVTPALARDLGLTDTKGALVWNMYRTASAYRAGLRPGDVIVAVDGKAIETPREFQRTLAELPIGRVITLGILREGARREIKVQIEQQQARTRAVAE
ncbi:MAG: trypsin-like peptidase domain-containing protein [Vicinamibacteria bacterium]